MAIGFNDPIPTNNVNLYDMYICWNKSLPASNLDLNSIVSLYNTSWSPDKPYEFQSFRGVRVYKMTFPDFSSNIDSPGGNDSVTIGILGGTSSITYTFTTTLSIKVGSLVTGDATCRFEEDGIPFCSSFVSAYGASGPESDVNSTTTSKSITVGSEILTAYISWNWDSPSTDNLANFTFRISPPASTSLVIHWPNPASKSAVRTYALL